MHHFNGPLRRVGMLIRFRFMGPLVPWQGRIHGSIPTGLFCPWHTADPQLAPDHTHTLTPAFKAASEDRLLPWSGGGPGGMRVCRLQIHT